MTAVQAPTVRFGELLGVAARHSSSTFNQILADAATPFEEWVVMSFLSRQGGISPKSDFVAEVAKRLQSDPDAIADHVDLMLRKRLLAEHDANGNTLIELTPTGAEFYRILGTKVDEVSAFELSTSSPEDIEAARRVLQQFSAQAEILAAK